MFFLEKVPRCSSGELGDEGGRGFPLARHTGTGRRQGMRLAAFSRE